MTDEEIAFHPLEFERLPVAEMERRGRALLERLARRRSVREFSDEPVPRELIETAVRIAGQAPSGANRQPWRFVAVGDPALKRKIRTAAEAEERLNYEGGRFPPEWLAALAPLGTTWEKPFLTTAPWLVIAFREEYGLEVNGARIKNYYVSESAGIACGFFIAALHEMGLVTLTHTPSPMGFLNELLRRPPNEKPFILFPVGYPATDARVPDIGRKPLESLLQWDDGGPPGEPA